MPAEESRESLRDKQITSLKRILSLNEDPNSDVLKNGLPWKVLVYDDLGRSVISPVLGVSDLRALGVTLHLHISSTRAPIPDVGVVYLVEPTAENLKAITNDLQKGLYETAYINFLSSIPRPLLEDFAAQTAATSTSEMISAIFDQHLNYISLEPDLFSLAMEKEHTYYALNSAVTTDEALTAMVEKIVTGLFSVVATMGVLPIIRCARNSAAEMIATRLDRRLRDLYLSQKDNMFGNRQTSSPASRPVMILCGREVDLVPMLAHSWSYQSLLYDVLKVHLNRVTLETPIDPQNPARGSTKKTYDLESTDYFWQENACLPFPHAAENIDGELSKYKEETSQLMKNTGVTNFEDLENENNANAQHLKNVVHQIPELQRRKKTLDNHMALLTAILGEIQARHLDNFYQLEQNVMKQTKAQVLELIKGDGKPGDKLRFFIIWYLSTEQDVTRQEWLHFDEALKEAGCDTTCLTYIRQVRATTKMTQLTTVNNAGSSAQQQAGSSRLFDRFSNLTAGLTDRLKETGVPTDALSSNVASLLGGIKNFLPVHNDLTVTKLVEAVMDPSNGNTQALEKTEGWLYFDPRSSTARGTMPQASALRAQAGNSAVPGGLPGMPGPGTGASFGQRRQGFSEAIVFMVGGGSMEEYSNLKDWAARPGSTRKITYGATELINASTFITEELGKLGDEIPK
ncbi:Sec1-like protein [Rhypophila decipiens]|uniref:Sec1-like protein n=1 Tax=Rhypophila decipiens TaxID=261697 RepID=A0AAN6YIZ1_9PEZI|nr:Sec1-like protein [Rhypophila decipiens]